MRTVDYSDVLQGSLALANILATDIDASSAEFAQMRAFHDRRLGLAWEIHAWPDLCRIEQRSFRPPWSPTQSYAAGAEVLDVPTLTYMLALQASTGQAPTTNAALNEAYWTPCQTQFQADDFVSGQFYTVGTVVRNPADGYYYQLFNDAFSMAVTGAGTTTVNATYPVTGTNDGKLKYGLPDNSGIKSVAGTWEILTGGSVPLLMYRATEAVATPDLVVTWTHSPLGVDPVPTVTPVAPEPTETAFWCRLTPFQRYVAYEQTDLNGTALTPLGEVFAAWDRDPRVTTKTARLAFRVTSDGFAFVNQRHTVAYVWLYFRLQRPLLRGNAFSTTAVYSTGQQVYYVTAAGAGNFYDCLGATTAGQTPETNPSLWDRVALPYIFRQTLIQGGYADWLTSDGQGDKAAGIEGQVEALLELEADKLQRQQQQVNRFNFGL